MVYIKSAKKKRTEKQKKPDQKIIKSRPGKKTIGRKTNLTKPMTKQQTNIYKYIFFSDFKVGALVA